MKVFYTIRENWIIYSIFKFKLKLEEKTDTIT